MPTTTTTAITPATTTTTGLDSTTTPETQTDTGDTTGTDNGWFEGFEWRKPIRIHVNTDLEEFPLGLLFEDDSDLMDGALLSGTDLVLTASDGVSLLPFELESYSMGNAMLWVDAGPLSAKDETLIYLYYGYTDGTPSTRDPAQTWPDRYEAVWHMHVEDLVIADSTSAAHRATAIGDAAATSSSEGILGPAALFDGINDTHRISDPADGSLDFDESDSFTVSFWSRSDESTGLDDSPLYKQAATPDTPGYSFNFGTSGWSSTIADGTVQDLDYGSDTVFLGDWHYIVMTVDRDAATVRAFIDGQPRVELALNTDGLENSNPLFFSRPFHWYSGLLDEIRIQRVAIDDARIMAEWLNVTDPAQLYTVDAPEAAPE